MNPRNFQCVQCNSAEYKSKFSHLTDRFYGKPGHFNLVQCNQCGLLQLESIPTDLSAFYSNYMNHKRNTKLFNFFQMALIGRKYPKPETKPGNLLDYGCGNGLFLERMKNKGWNVVGCEYEASYAKELEQVLNIEVHTPFELYPRYENYFDVITFNFSFEHVTNPKEVIEMAYRLLNTNGIVYIMVPNPEGVESSIFKNNWYHLDPPRHITLFNKQQLSTLLTHTGFTNITIRDVGIPIGFAGSVSYLLLNRWDPFVWYPAIPLGVLFSFLIRDGNYIIKGSKP